MISWAFALQAMRDMRAAVAATLVILALGVGCTRQDARLEQHKKKFESLGATTKVVSEAWLSGQVSGTYTLAALDQTFHLVEQERTALAAKPAMLRDTRGAALSQGAEQLSRLIASIIGDVTSADGQSVREQLTKLPIVPQKQP
jgi:hypothetical protein